MRNVRRNGIIDGLWNGMRNEKRNGRKTSLTEENFKGKLPYMKKFSELEWIEEWNQEWT